MLEPRLPAAERDRRVSGSLTSRQDIWESLPISLPGAIIWLLSGTRNVSDGWRQARFGAGSAVVSVAGHG